MAYEPSRWTIEIWSDESTDETAGDIVHDACRWMMTELIRQGVKNPAVYSSGKGGPLTRERIREAMKSSVPSPEPI